MGRLRVLHLAWRLSPGGGVAQVARDLLQGASREEFDVHVCSVRPFCIEDDIEALGGGLTFHSLGLEGDKSLAKSARLTAGLFRLVAKVRPHVVHVQAGSCPRYLVPVTMVKGRTKVVLQVHDSPQSERNSKRNEQLERLLIRRLRYRPVVDSTSARDDLVSAYGVGRDHVRLIPLGIDTERFSRPAVSRETWRQAEGIPADADVVLYVARLVPSKNLPLFVEVAERVLEVRPGTYFLVVGAGPARPELERIVEERGLGGRLRVLGFRLDLVEAYHASDLFLSTSDYEGFGLAIVEAMAAGKPVVSTDCGGPRDIVVPGVTGFLTPVAVGPLVESVTALLDDRDLRTRLGAAGRARARERFDLTAMARGFEGVYRELAGR